MNVEFSFRLDRKDLYIKGVVFILDCRVVDPDSGVLVGSGCFDQTRIIFLKRVRIRIGFLKYNRIRIRFQNLVGYGSGLTKDTSIFGSDHKGLNSL